jgi:hypothetical protein
VPKIEVEVRGMDVLRRKLDAGNLLAPVKEGMIQGAAKDSKQTAEEASKGRYGKKGLRNRFFIDYEQDGLIAKVHPDRSIMGIAFTMDQGRRPGKSPPQKALRPWADAAGITDIRQLQQDIRAGGTRPIGFMQDAEQAAQRSLQHREGPTERAIEREFNSG